MLSKPAKLLQRMKNPQWFLKTTIVLSGDDEEEQDEILRKINGNDNEYNSPAVVDLREAATIFTPVDHDSAEENEQECAIILKSGRTIWVKTPYKEVEQRWLALLDV